MKKILIVTFMTMLAATSFAMDINDDMRAFAANMENCYGVSETEVLNWLSNAQYDETALRRMDSQTEAKPWTYYKPLFVTDMKSLKGLDFYMNHQTALMRAEKQYGVSRYVIAAILGVETDFGQYKLPHRAVDTLATLAFYYPRRASFFQNELKWLFLLADEEGSDPMDYASSYAGAVGMPQFMPSNIKKYGVDFDNDGRIDLVRSADDAIGSVARYLKAHGYKLGEPTAVMADLDGNSWDRYANKGAKPKYTVAELMKNGVIPQEAVDAGDKAALYSFPMSETTSENWLFFNNFYSITRYNPSVRYALAVVLLSRQIRTKVHYAEDCGILED